MPYRRRAVSSSPTSLTVLYPEAEKNHLDSSRTLPVSQPSRTTSVPWISSVSPAAITLTTATTVPLSPRPAPPNLKRSLLSPLLKVLNQEMPYEKENIASRTADKVDSLVQAFSVVKSPPRSLKKPPALHNFWLKDPPKFKHKDLPKDSVERAEAIADIVSTLLAHDASSKRLLLRLALHRRDHKHHKTDSKPPNKSIPEGFFWSHYPPLEAVLHDAMEEYYTLSLITCQTTKQQQFNGELTDRIRQAAHDHGWDLPMSDKELRDRIRCYYKTHIQNAKKRLLTMVGNPRKKANAKQLLACETLILQVM